jgi:hypothetical protein
VVMNDDKHEQRQVYRFRNYGRVFAAKEVGRLMRLRGGKIRIYHAPGREENSLN